MAINKLCLSSLILFNSTGHINNFVRINFSLLTSEVICTFLTNGTTEQRCSVVYGPRLQCVNATLRSEGTRHDDNLISDSVRINLPSLPRHQSVDNNFCFIITASDGLNTVKVEGSFNAGNIMLYIAIYIVILVVHYYHTIILLYKYKK